jgi:hypothetical protein
MKKNNLFYPILIVIFLFTSIYEIDASDSYIKTNSECTISDSLIIKSRHSDKTKVINIGQMIKVWYVDNEPITGILQSTDQDKIMLRIGDETKEISKNTIYKIQTQTDKNKKVFGWILISLAIGIFGLALFGAFVAAAFGDIGNALLVLFLLSIPGTGALLGGSRLKGKKYDMFKKWKF